MQLTPLTTLSPLDGRYHQQTRGLAEIFSEYGLMKNRLLIEIRWLMALAAEPQIQEVPGMSHEQQQLLESFYHDFNIKSAERVKQIEATINHDVKAIEYYLKEKLSNEESLTPYREFVHFAATSEDINNLSYALMCLEARNISLLPQMLALLDIMQAFSKEHSSLAMLSRTHGQTASPTTLGKEFANFHARLSNQIEALETIEMLGKFNGAVGNFNAHVCAYPGVDWQALSETFIRGLGLTPNPMTTQIEPHDFIAELCHNISRINTILIDCSRDIWSYIAIGYLQQASKSQEVGSSTMPHKVNPIDFENAEGNLGMSNALLAHFADKLPISRWQRDLSDSTVLRNLGMAFGFVHIAINALIKGLNKISPNTQTIQTDLNNHWEVLAEAIQTVMRRHGLPQPYEQLKTLTRGQCVDKTAMHDFIQSLTLPDTVKQQLLQLTPETYTGLATKLC